MIYNGRQTFGISMLNPMIKHNDAIEQIVSEIVFKFFGNFV